MNLYVHFPFCRNKCSYCALYSRAGTSVAEREAYVRERAREIEALADSKKFKSVYFGGGTPGLCDLRPVFAALERRLVEEYEFTVELHPLDVSVSLLETLKAGGVNRVSMGVQSLEDEVLQAMGRGYTAAEAKKAFGLVRRCFDNAGIDLIVGYPGSTKNEFSALGDWGLKHCSVYSLQNERGLKGVPDDERVMDDLASAAKTLDGIGLKRYEISNYAVEGFECRHNFAVWRGEDYLGLGEGACGREGLKRIRGVKSSEGVRYEVEEVTADFDFKERRLFQLRTCEGIAVEDIPEWEEKFQRLEREGFVRLEISVTGVTKYVLTSRGTEICDSILLDFV